MENEQDQFNGGNESTENDFENESTRAKVSEVIHELLEAADQLERIARSHLPESSDADVLQKIEALQSQLDEFQNSYLGAPEVDSDPEMKDFEASLNNLLENAQEQMKESREKYVQAYIESEFINMSEPFEDSFGECANASKAKELLWILWHATAMKKSESWIQTGEAPEDFSKWTVGIETAYSGKDEYVTGIKISFHYADRVEQNRQTV